MENCVSTLLHKIVEWAKSEPHISGIALVGSHARGTATADSDIDLILLCMPSNTLVSDPGWTQRFGVVDTCHREEWGRITVLRVRYTDGMEVEFGLTSPAWAALPADAGTKRVVSNGMRILWDCDGALARLQQILCT